MELMLRLTLDTSGGNFKGTSYNSPSPSSIYLPNSSSCIDFGDFIASTLLERLENGSLSVWGEVGNCTPPTFGPPSRFSLPNHAYAMMRGFLIYG